MLHNRPVQKLRNVQWTVGCLMLLGSIVFLLLHLSTIPSTNIVLPGLRTTRDAVKQNAMRNQSSSYMEFENEDDRLSIMLQSNCVDDYTVPNIVHYVWLNKTFLEFHEYVSMLSASKFVKPCNILLHGDTIPGGKWWDLLLSQVHNIIHVKRKPPKEIFGRKFGYIEHKADVMRLQILMEYGGIYADTDLYFLRSFDSLRNYELTLSRETNYTIANGLIVSNKRSFFLHIWYLTYRTYDANSWAENSVFMASKLEKLLPSLVHMEPGMIMLGEKYDSVFSENLNWNSTRYSVHLYARSFKRRDFELEDVKTLNTSFGALTRYVIYGVKRILLD